jgi:TonB family protein
MRRHFVALLAATGLSVSFAGAQEKTEPPAQQAPAKRIAVVRVVRSDIEEAVLINKVEPKYPGTARAARISGVVQLRALIAKDGAVTNLMVISGHPLLAEAAIDAVRQWRYQPTRLNGNPVEVEMTIDVSFTPEGGTTEKSSPKPAPDGEAQTGTLGGIQGSADPNATPPKPPVKRVRQGGQVAAAMIIKRVPPKYPNEARDKRVQGVVRLHVIIGKDGSVSQLEAISGHSLLIEAAIDAVRQWKYRPTLLNGEPVEVETVVDVIFTLN